MAYVLKQACYLSYGVNIHPSDQRIREALEKLPGVRYMNELLESGVLNLNFQAKHRVQRE